MRPHIPRFNVSELQNFHTKDIIFSDFPTIALWCCYAELYKRTKWGSTRKIKIKPASWKAPTRIVLNAREAQRERANNQSINNSFPLPSRILNVSALYFHVTSAWSRAFIAQHASLLLNWGIWKALLLEFRNCFLDVWQANGRTVPVD